MIRDEEYDGFYLNEKFNVSSKTLSGLLEEQDEMNESELTNYQREVDEEVYSYETK